ncbi:hypothetical protein [Streptomyces sp. bgisy159]|uniref:hypothetical protein n=1 Tax=Streptomyces sp. bgisy159 TaxID=3413795 RepID=UPI003F4A0299
MRTRLTAAAVGAALALTLTGCAFEVSDPRAYPGTYEDLDPVLDSFRLTLPSCEVADLRYTGRSKEWGRHLYLRFEAPTACVESYLTAHGVDLAHPRHWPDEPGFTVDGEQVLSPTAPPFPDEAVEKFGLKLDPRRT